MNSFTRAAQVWLAIASGGGKWEAAEVRKELPALSARSVDQALLQLQEGDMVTRFEDGRYGITDECRIPRGLSVKEVLEAMGAAT